MKEMQEFFCGIVEDKLLWEIHFPDKGESIGKVSDVGMAMTVAGEKYRIMVFLTKLQYSPVILFYVAAVAIGGKGAVVDFQKDAVVYGSFYKAAIVDRIFRIVRMGDNADIRVFYSTETGSRIFFFGSGGEAGRVHTRHTIVKVFHNTFRQVQGAGKIQNIYFCPVQYTDSHANGRGCGQPAEIRKGTGMGDCRPVLADSQ